MTDFASLFDPYSRQARLYPALLSLLPPLVMIIAWYPDVVSGVGTTIVTIAASCGALYALGMFSRALGKKREKQLLTKWGGWPTTIWLRHRSSFLQPQTLARYHKFLAEHVPGLALPSAEDEARDPKLADQQYASAVEWLKEQARGKDFPLVDKENAEYGFRRNVLGMKPVAVAACAAALVFSAAAIGISYGDFISVPRIVLAAVAFNIIGLVGWLLFVRDRWVREAGDQYARALLAVCDAPGGEKKVAVS
jgi:hypothetical protein